MLQHLCESLLTQVVCLSASQVSHHNSPINQEMDIEDLQIVPYGYSVLDYARRYDATWIGFIEKFIRSFHGLKLHGKSCGPIAAFAQIYYEYSKFERSSYSPKRVDMSTFPTENLFQVFQYLDDESLLVAGSVSHTWRVLSSSGDLWNSLLKSRFCVSIDYIDINMSELIASWPEGFELSKEFSHPISQKVPFLSQSSLPSSKLIFQLMRRTFQRLTLQSSRNRCGGVSTMTTTVPHSLYELGTFSSLPAF